MNFLKKILNKNVDLLTNVFVVISFFWLMPVLILFLFCKFVIGIPVNYVIGKLK
jgi:hypothetical protein